MIMFDKNKDIILRILNLVLIVWFLVAVVLLYSGSINLIANKPKMNYGTYRNEECGKCTDKLCSEMLLSSDTDCKSQYTYYIDNLDIEHNGYIKQVCSSFMTSITVGATLYLLNKKQKKGK